MTVLVPDEFRDEVLAAKEEELDDLRYDVSGLIAKGTALPKIVDGMEKAGWSRGFAEWYVHRVRAEGRDLRIHVPAETEFDRHMAEYRRAKQRKDFLRNWGVACSFIGLGLIVVAAVMVPAEGSDKAIAPETLYIASGLLFAGIAVKIKGAVMILDSKGRSRWLWRFGIFTILCKDDNKLIEPTRRQASKHEGQMLSDW